ncbi:hypothetical protein GCM10007877_23880 [Marinibactrum halimedae]|uniref:Uncharacterized protein n=1 Tax=Marinibactrum halimedae TaxID=1444977 RepID=A0AA37T6G0_9GAMM|nr:hypothetical protein GCM10007877_23880 [Marinibactrum halimedae]
MSYRKVRRFLNGYYARVEQARAEQSSPNKPSMPIGSNQNDQIYGKNILTTAKHLSLSEKPSG